MTLFVCVDERGGMAWCGRRQSRDRAVYEDIVKLTVGIPLLTDVRSASLFDAESSVIVSDESPEGNYARFIEFESPAKYAGSVRRLVVYCWNRHYPSDLQFDLSLDHFRLIEEYDFSGTSHECITRRIYEYDPI